MQFTNTTYQRVNNWNFALHYNAFNTFITSCEASFVEFVVVFKNVGKLLETNFSLKF